MPKPYRYNLRYAVIQAILLDGLKISEASIVFNISRNTISIWLKRQAETGNFQALPSYSPDLNKIEQCWFWLKSRIRKQLAQFDCLRDAIEDVLRFAS